MIILLQNTCLILNNYILITKRQKIKKKETKYIKIIIIKSIPVFLFIYKNKKNYKIKEN